MRGTLINFVFFKITIFRSCINSDKTHGYFLLFRTWFNQVVWLFLVFRVSRGITNTGYGETIYALVIASSRDNLRQAEIKTIAEIAMFRRVKESRRQRRWNRSNQTYDYSMANLQSKNLSGGCYWSVQTCTETQIKCDQANVIRRPTKDWGISPMSSAKHYWITAMSRHNRMST